jgi:capsular exopolysaccharide synthesis family protein
MILRRGFRYIPFVLLCGIIAGGITYLVARSSLTYTASSTIALTSNGDSAELVTGASTSSSSSETLDVTTQAPFLFSQSVAREANAIVEREIHRSLSAYTPSANADAQTLSVVASSPNRAVAAATANAVLQAYTEQSVRQQRGLLTSAIRQVRRRLASIRKELTFLNRDRNQAAASQRSAYGTEYQTAYSQLQSLLSQQGISESEFTNIVRATPSSASPSSTRKLGLLGLVLGLALAALISLARELALGYVKGARDVVLNTPGAVMLARLPSLRRGARPGVVGPDTQPSSTAYIEALRRVRVNLSLLQPASQGRMILVASPDPSEGRSLIAANLAASWARTGRRVLLVASDLRHPDVGALVGQPGAEPGLTDLLSHEREDVEGMVVETDQPNLSLLGPGSVLTDPMDLLEAETLSATMNYLASQWDVVIFDSPPLLKFGDAVLLADKVNAVILVATVGRTRMKRLRTANGILESVGAKHIFTVANRESGDSAPALNINSELAEDPDLRTDNPSFSASQA